MEKFLPKKEHKKTISIISTISTIIVILLCIALLVIIYLISPLTISGDSMEPTLSNGEHIVLLKKFYSIDYGDIVIFAKISGGKKLIKRVIGKEGDYIRYDIEEKAYYRNGEKLQEDYIKEQYKPTYISLINIDPDLFLSLTSDEGLLVGENQLFVLGDNRNISNDSHYFGCIDKDLIIGKYLFSY